MPASMSLDVRFGSALMAGCLILAGCTGSPSSGPPKTSASSPAPSKADLATDVLISALYQLKPENLTIDSSAESAISVLNDWRVQSGLISADKFGMTAEDLKALPPDLLTDEQRTAVLATEFDNTDAYYIRNALLTHKISQHATQHAADDLARIIALFEFTMRNVTLTSAPLPRLPLFDVIRGGQGTAVDRGWVFAALLKQQRFDSVILQAKGDPERQLVGVILDGEVYLFDTRLGLPIPKGDEALAVRITRPATLTEMQAHPDWWQGLTVRADQPYPWTAEELASADIFAYTEAESVSGRMKQLETVLPPDSACVLYDPLIDAGNLRGLMHRVAAGNSGWQPDRLRLWPYPLNARVEALKVRQDIQSFNFRFRVPLEFVFAEESPARLLELKPSYQLAKCRMEQLLGDYAGATAHYLTVRHLMVEGLPSQLQVNQQTLQEVQRLYSLAVFDASYWTAICKREQGELEAAANSFADYLNRFPRSPWIPAARLNLSLSLAESGKLADAQAIGILGIPQDPHRDGLDILINRWSKLAEPKTDQKPNTDAAEKPADAEAKNGP